MKTVRLSNGAVVRVRPVPPHVGYQLYRKALAGLPPEPKVPMSKIRSAAGHEELAPADQESPEYQAWQAEHAAWMERYQTASRDADMRNADFALDYSVVAWKLVAPFWRRLFQRWQFDPPTAWHLPDAITRHGAMEASDNCRLDFIKVELVTSPHDMEATRLAMMGETAPLRQEEVEAAYGGFPTNAE